MLSRDLNIGHRLWHRSNPTEKSQYKVVDVRIRNGYRQFDVRAEQDEYPDIPFWLTFGRIRRFCLFSKPSNGKQEPV